MAIVAVDTSFVSQHMMKIAAQSMNFFLPNLTEIMQMTFTSMFAITVTISIGCQERFKKRGRSR